MRYSAALLLAICIAHDNTTKVQASIIDEMDQPTDQPLKLPVLESSTLTAEDAYILKGLEDPAIDREFTEFNLKFNKSHKDTLNVRERKTNYLKSKNKIDEFRLKKNKTSTVKINEMADLDDTEIKSLMSLKLDPITIETDNAVNDQYKLKKESKRATTKASRKKALRRNRRQKMKAAKNNEDSLTIASDYDFDDFGDSANNEALDYDLDDFDFEDLLLAETQQYPLECDYPEVFWTGDNGWMLDDVLNQGKCGSCWAFAAIEAIEAAFAIYYGQFVQLSIQYLVDCMTYKCSGGLITTVFDWSIHSPIPERSNYREYAGDIQSCASPINQLGVSARNHYEVAISTQELIRAIHKQPVAGAVQADSSDFIYYDGGLISGDDCGYSVNHAIMIVGYGCLEETQTDYFLIKNSWGATWGDKGFARISASLSDHQYGTCGIKRLVSYPIIEDMKVVEITAKPDSSQKYTS